MSWHSPTDRQRVGDDEMVSYPPMMFWQSDLDRLRAWAIENHIGDSATALRCLLDTVSTKPEQERA